MRVLRDIVLMVGAVSAVISAVCLVSFVVSVESLKRNVRDIQESLAEAPLKALFDSARLLGLGPSEEKEAAAADEPPKRASWMVKHSKSPIDDSPEVTATLKATKGDASLIARCKERKTEFLFKPKYRSVLRTLDGKGYEIISRVDRSPAVTESWRPAWRDDSAASPTATDTIGALKDGSQLFVRAASSPDIHHDYTFDLGDVSEVREQIRQACSWSEPAQNEPTVPPVAIPASGPAWANPVLPRERP